MPELGFLETTALYLPYKIYPTCPASLGHPEQNVNCASQKVPGQVLPILKQAKKLEVR
ncbi:MAG: hypothetical protein CM1200mP28_17940 [Deltaproteobacteria bacterium]|nr:MAG: hypothetical protein CM1200mP28_17940 [Deltaproteobacteria bacterium]